MLMYPMMPCTVAAFTMELHVKGLYLGQETWVSPVDKVLLELHVKGLYRLVEKFLLELHVKETLFWVPVDKV